MRAELERFQVTVGSPNATNSKYIAEDETTLDYELSSDDDGNVKLGSNQEND